MPPLHPLPGRRRRLWGRSQTTYAQQKERERLGKERQQKTASGNRDAVRRKGRSARVRGAKNSKGRTGLAARSSRCCWRGLVEGQRAFGHAAVLGARMYGEVQYKGNTRSAAPGTCTVVQVALALFAGNGWEGATQRYSDNLAPMHGETDGPTPPLSPGRTPLPLGGCRPWSACPADRV